MPTTYKKNKIVIVFPDTRIHRRIHRHRRNKINPFNLKIILHSFLHRLFLSGLRLCFGTMRFNFLICRFHTDYLNLCLFYYNVLIDISFEQKKKKNTGEQNKQEKKKLIIKW